MIECNKASIKMSGPLLTLMAEATLIAGTIGNIMAEELGLTKKEALKQITNTVLEADKRKKNDDS